jgi:hypothetical protein
MSKASVFRTIQTIAQRHLGVETLEPRNIDAADYKECSVWGLRAALEAAYKAGVDDERLSALEYYRDK